MGEEYPPFQLGKSRFDQSTFRGRLRHFLDITDPRTLFTSKRQLEESIELLDRYKNGTLPSDSSHRQLWQAQKIKQAIIHPDTGEKIIMPFRMSGYVPFGSPMVVGLLLPNPTVSQMIFWQWLNQSHNACVNYANRNATKETPMSRFVLGYTGAVTLAIGIALGLSALIKKSSGLSPAAKLIIQKFVPFPAVATASAGNVILMRNSELSTGIEIVDSNNKPVGTSKTAAKKALKEMALTRMFLPSPIFIIPPIILTYLERTRLLKTYPRLHLPCNAVVSTLSFAVALPVAIALFPQFSSISRSLLEPEIQAVTNEEVLYYNKGL